MQMKMMTLALLTLAGTAMAQPGTFTDLGDRTATQSFTQNVTSLGGSDIQWFRIELPAVQAAAGWVDVWTTPTGDTSTDMTDTEIGLYDDFGNGASTGWNDDDDGPGLFSALSYGSTTSRGTTTYAGQTAGAARNGRDGDLPGGVYWLAVGRYNVNWTTGFGAGGTSTSTQTTTLLNFDIQAATAPFPPSATGASSPANVAPMEAVLYTVTVVPGGNPVSTGITVHGDLSAVGGASNALFHDDGLDGDAAAGDGVYSLMYTIPDGTVGGAYTVAVTVSDDQSRSGSASITGGVFNPLDLGTLVDGTTLSTEVALSATEVKWYRANFSDCSEAAHRNLEVTTGNSTQGGDSEIGFYDNAGTLVATNDDSVGLLSRLTFGYLGTSGDIGAGTYYIAVGSYNVTFASGFSAVTTGGANTFQLDMLQTSTFPPTAVGAATGVDLSNILMTVTVTPGTNPDSTGIAVSADLSGIGGSSTQAFFDDGTHGDVTAGDNVFSYNFTTNASTPVGPFSATATVTDDQNDNVSVTLNGSVVSVPDALDLGQIGAGAGGSEVVTTHDTDIFAGAVTWLKFSVGTDVTNDGSGKYLDIDTEPSGGPGSDGTPTIGSINDTELGLYNEGGTFMLTDDDDGSDWHSQLTFGDTNARAGFGNGVAPDGRDGDLTTGTYYLAAGCFNSVFNNFFDATSTSAAGGTIQVNFRTNIPGGGTGPCSVADVGMAGGVAGQDHLLNNNDFIAFITLFFASDPQADMGMAGGLPGSDGQWNNNDFIAFIGHFFSDAAACNG